MVGVSEIQSQPRLMSSPTGSSLARHDEDELNLQGVRAMTEPRSLSSNSFFYASSSLASFR
jgi:hypothetical protein